MSSAGWEDDWLGLHETYFYKPVETFLMIQRFQQFTYMDTE